ncbi:DNA-binding transcriptional MerR regulator [Lipingzhangella halophila]|uniref:DNA-binding transcriptional MerR regulator n=1 Tax=Lipingzhangella halophila TaxID=1783352 RepID=A0A7W7RLU5_9ACTN|nr:MerR family transcriptional regulator [Lipingzhangella halophila]MBB4934344.1 DNA-binding transcriptional MerR regulator [Lipingzhangella halophila]
MRQLAGLAGTTVKTIRHYHAIDLLEEPERAINGYKQYGTSHLVRVLQIKRLRGLGMSLAEIAGLEESDEDFTDAVRALDAQFAASIERQQAIRAELADLLAHRTGPDVPAGFESVAESLTPADRRMIMVSTQLFDDESMRDVRDIAAHHQEADAAFNDLSADADAGTVRAVATRLAPVLRTIHERYPGTRNPPIAAGGRKRDVVQALNQALTDFYNPAQIEALWQAFRLVQEDPPDESEH